jgi:hypothetical protein
MKTRSILSVLFSVLLFSCADFLASVEKHKDWQVHEQGKIVLYSRPAGFTQSASPDDFAVSTILNNQNFYYDAINKALGLNYPEKVYIYLYNLDEAFGAIGTQNGGHSYADRSAIYYTYMRPDFIDGFGRKAFIGSHEMVNVITQNTLGRPYTKLMSDGYSVAFSGTYGRQKVITGIVIGKPVIDWMVMHYLSNKILSPEELLTETDHPEAVYLPNAGFFIMYLWQRFGTDKINKLFSVGKDSFRKHFELQTGVSWQQIALDYHLYCQQVFNPGSSADY